MVFLMFNVKKLPKLFTAPINFLFIVFVLKSEVSFCQKEPHGIQLRVGQWQDIEIPSQLNISLSRKSIVDLSFLGSNKWRLTGLRSGFVVLSYLNGDTLEKSQIFITVKRESKSQNKKKTVFPSWLCHYKDAHCNASPPYFEGKWDDITGFMVAKTTCQQVSGCSFKTLLAKDAIEKQQSKIQQMLGDSYQVEVKEQGALLIMYPCDGHKKRDQHHKSYIHTLLEGSPLVDSLYTGCVGEFIKKQYELFSKVTLVETSGGQEEGFKSSLGFTLKDFSLVSDSSFIADFSNRAKNKKMTILGEPYMILQSGETGRLKSGGELPFLRSSPIRRRNEQEYWKEYGVDLTVSIKTLSKKEAFLEYDLKLKNPSNSSSKRSFNTNSLSGSLQIVEKKEVVVGRIRYQTNQMRHHLSPLFNQIPIVGPLFKILFQETGFVHIYLSFEVRELS